MEVSGSCITNNPVSLMLQVNGSLGSVGGYGESKGATSRKESSPAPSLKKKVISTDTVRASSVPAVNCLLLRDFSFICI